MTTSSHSHSHAKSSHVHPHASSDGEASSVTRIQRLAMFLEAHFGEVELHMPETTEEEPESQEDAHQDPSLLVQLDDADAQINLVTLVCFFHVSSAYGSSYYFAQAVTSSNETLKKRVEGVLDMALTTVSSLSESFISGVPVVTEEAGLSQEKSLFNITEAMPTAVL